MAGHLAAGVCVWVVPLALWLRILLLSALVLNMLYVLRHQAGHAWPFSITALQFERDGLVLAECRNGQILEATVLASSFVAPYLSIILLKFPGVWFTRSVVLLPDMLTTEMFRRTRVWLKWRLGRGAVPEASVDWTGQL